MAIDLGMTLRKIVVYGTLFVLFMVVVLFLDLMGINGYLIALVCGGFLFVQYFFSDKLVLWSTGARVLNDEEAPALHSLVEKLAVEMGIPKPKVAIVQSDMPNAFATGRNRSHAVVAVTTGILNRLDKNEMEAVLAHELSHVKNRDMFVVTFASFLVTVLSYIFAMLVSSMLGGKRGSSMIGWFVASILANTIGLIIINTISRYREYGADRGSALATKNPDWLISALRKISESNYSKQGATNLESARALCISPTGGALMELFSTHPRIEKRIAHLEKIKEEMYGY